MDTKLVEQRKKMQLTQKEIAKRSGISERYYQKLECRMAIPSVQIAILVAQVLNATVESLFESGCRKHRGK